MFFVEIVTNVTAVVVTRIVYVDMFMLHPSLQ